MGIRDLILRPFWDGWIERFNSEKDSLITPSNPVVLSEVERIGTIEGSDEEVVNALWNHITTTIQYRLSKKWKTPEETLRSGIGDCEDMDFLLLSLLPNYGIYDAKLVIGLITTQRDRNGLHVWVEHNGRVIDPTGQPEDVEGVRYEPTHKFTIRYDR